MTSTVGAFNSDVTFTSSFFSGFSGFGIGVYSPGIPGAPTADFSPSSSTECVGGCITFTDASNSTDPGGITSWSWDFGDGNVSSSASPTHCYTTSGSYVVSLTITDGIASDNHSILVEIGDSSSFSQTANLCPGQTVSVGTNTYSSAGTYTDVLSNAAGCDSVVTTTVNQLASSTFSQTIDFCEGGSVTVGTSTYTTSGTYTDILTNAEGCDSTVTTNLTVYSNPTPVIDNTAGLDSVCENSSSLLLTASPSGGTFSGSGMSGSTFNPLTAGVGTHIVTYSLTDGNGCTGEDQLTIVVIDCSVEISNSELNEFKLYPNPNNGNFVISGLAVGSSYQILDKQGKLVRSDMVNSEREEISLKNVSDGIYFLKISASGKETSIKFTVTND